MIHAMQRRCTIHAKRFGIIHLPPEARHPSGEMTMSYVRSGYYPVDWGEGIVSEITNKSFGE